MAPEDIRELVQHLKSTQLEMEVCVRDGKCHVGRFYETFNAFTVMVIDLEETIFELVHYREIISIKIITE